MSNKKATLTVRLITDHANNKTWFEEYITQGNWVTIPETLMSCEGNSRHELENLIDARRKKRLAIHRTVSPPEVFDI